MFKSTYGHSIMLCIFLLCSALSRAQLFDSLQTETGIESHFSSAAYQPLWLIANRHGTVADRRNDLITYLRISNKNVIGQKEYTDPQGFFGYDDITFSYGVSIYNNNHFRSVIMEEAYGKLEYKNLSIRAGRF